MEKSIFDRMFKNGTFTGLTVKQAIEQFPNHIDWNKIDIEEFYLFYSPKKPDFRTIGDANWNQYLSEQNEIEEQLASYDNMTNYNNCDIEDYPSIHDNEYYNDDLDIDQQSVDFWNSL